MAVDALCVYCAGLPPELYTILEAYPWRFGESYCLFKTFLTEMTSSASILTIAAFTVERYLAICHSLRAQATSGLSRAVRVVVVVWVAACVTAVPYPIHTRTFHYLQHPETGRPLADSLICTIPSQWMPNMRYAFQVLSYMVTLSHRRFLSILESLPPPLLARYCFRHRLSVCRFVRRITDKSSAVAEVGDRGHNRHGPKRWGLCARFAQRWDPVNTMWPGPRSTSVPSGAFIHPPV